MKYFFFLALSCLCATTACTETQKTIRVTVVNPATFDREHEMVEIAWTTVCEKLSLQDGQSVVVHNDASEEIPCQLITEGNEVPVSLIFPVSLAGNGKNEYRITVGKSAHVDPMTYGRLVPERKDDFTWENNRSAFRVYGPALEATGEISNGMDFWAKRTDALVIDRWYKDDLTGIRSYHEDHGEGLDFYKVGRTLGLGMTAPYVNDSLWLGNNFTEYRILDQGPLRIAFELRYKPYNVQGFEVNETRRISLDAYSYLNRIEQIFEADTAEMTLATGIVLHAQTPEDILSDAENGIMACETPTDSINGTIYAGVIRPESFREIRTGHGHLLGISPYHTKTNYVYYAGAGWSKAGFDNFAAWIDFLKQEAIKIKQPLKINVE